MVSAVVWLSVWLDLAVFRFCVFNYLVNSPVLCSQTLKPVFLIGSLFHPFLCSKLSHLRMSNQDKAGSSYVSFDSPPSDPPGPPLEESPKASSNKRSNIATFAGINFTGDIAHYLIKQQEGYKVMIFPLKPDDCDSIFKRLDKVNLTLLSLVPGSSSLNLEQALLTSQYEKNFSSPNIKNGVLFDIATIGGVGSICNFMNYLYDDHIQQALRSQNEDYKDLAGGLLKRKEVFIQKWSIYHQFEAPKIPLSPNEKSTHSHEHVDVVEFSKVIGIFGPVLTVQIHEAPLNYGRKELPHGNLDILVVSPVSNTRMGVLIIDGVSDQVLLTGSMKTEDSIDSPSSERQAIIELLTLAECCKDSLCVLLLANRKEFITYLYHRPTDVLLRSDKMGYQNEEGISGCFVLSVLLEHSYIINQNRFQDMVASLKEKGVYHECGWGKLMCANKIDFSGTITTQKKSTRKRGGEHPSQSFKNLCGEDMLKARQRFLEKFEQ